MTDKKVKSVGDTTISCQVFDGTVTDRNGRRRQVPAGTEEVKVNRWLLGFLFTPITPKKPKEK